MSEAQTGSNIDSVPVDSSWPVTLLKGTTVSDSEPVQTTHPAVIAVCNVLMFDGPAEHKAWHIPAEHVRTRETMEQCISHLILQRRPSASQEWIEKLPDVSKRIEKNLYFTARSIDEYSDPYTLVNRIQDLVKVLIATAATLPVPDISTAPSDTQPNSKPNDSSKESGETKEQRGNENGKAERSAATADSSTASASEGLQPGATGLSKLLGSSTSSADLTQTPLYLVPLKEAERTQQQAAAVTAAVNAFQHHSQQQQQQQQLQQQLQQQQQQPMYLSSQVSSQGCSRVFIIKVLISVSEFVKGKSLPSIFTFKRELVMEWLIAAKQACCMPTYMAEEGYYGGPPFVSPDPSTHWSEPHQLYTWWKNNVERRSKFKVLQEDAKFKGLDPRRLQRARWCEAVVALSELIRASSGSSNASRTALLNNNSSTTQNGGAGNAGSSNSSSNSSSMATGMSSAYLQALSAGLSGGSFPSEDTTSESSTNGFFRMPGMPPYSQAHSAPLTSADDRSGIDALMNMSSELNSLLGVYGKGPPPLPTGLTSANGAPSGLDALIAVKNEPSLSDPFSSGGSLSLPASHLAPYLPQQHLYPAGNNSNNNNSGSAGGGIAGGDDASTVAKADALLGLTPGLTAAMQSAGLSLDSALGTPSSNLLSKFIPPSSNLIIGTHIIPGTNIPYRNYSNTFPVKLFDLVSGEDEAVVGWQGHGTSFQVRDMDKFVNVVLPKHFKHNNFTSFQRQLNLYGFRRSASYDKGAYYHPQFQQGQRELAESIRRVLAPTSGGGPANSPERLDGTGNGNGTGGGGGGGGNSAHSLAMSYLSGLPPGMSVNMPGMGGAGAAESLLSMGMGMGMGGPAGGAGSGHPPGSAADAAFWQSIANKQYSNGPSGGPYNGGHPAYGSYGGPGSANGNGMEGIGIDGTTGNYGFGGTFNMMSQIAQGYHNTNQFKVPARGYNRNSKRSTDGDGEHPRKVKLSAKDRKRLDLSNAHAGLNAEQFLASTVISDRYNLGNNSNLLSVQPHHHHHHHAHHHSSSRTAAGEDGAEGSKRGRGRPTKKRASRQHLHSDDEYDEATYQDGADPEGLYHHHHRASNSNTSHRTTSKAARKTKPSQRAAAMGMGDDDSVSSASQVGATLQKGAKRASGSSSRNASYKNLPQDVFAKSGLSRNSAITHLTQEAEEDLLDLRIPQTRRVYLDFTVIGHLGAEAAAAGVKAEGEDGSALDYVCGFYRGALTQGKKDVSLHYQLHGSRALPEALLRLNSERAATASPDQSLSSMIAAQNKTNEPRSTRVGDDYQCDVPAMAVPGGVTRHSAPSYGAEPVWRPNVLSAECVDAFVALLHARKKLIPLPVGSVLVVHLVEEKAYRLCCVLDMFFGDPTPRDPADGTPRTPATPGLGKLMEGSTVRVFDGYEDWVVPSEQCMTFKEGEMEQALQILVKYDGNLTQALVQEVDSLLQSGVSSEGGVGTNTGHGSWSSEEVLRFCNAVKRYGDNIKKVWTLRFADSGKSIDEVQEFFLRIYPHTQLGGAKRVVSVYSRGELAAAGYPDGEASDSDGAENEEEEEEEGGLGEMSSNSASESVSGSSSESELENEIESDLLEVEGSTTASRGTASSEAGNARAAKGRGSAGMKKIASTSSLPSTTTAAVPAAAGGGRRSSGAASVPVPIPVPVVPEAEERRSGRKRGAAAVEESLPAPAAANIPVHALVTGAPTVSTVAAAVEAKKRRR